MLLGLVLLYVGAVLFINGLSLLGKIAPREAGIMNIFTGVIAFLVCIHNSFSDLEDTIQSAAYGLLFSLTYLWVAYNNLTGQDGRGLGWFSLFVAITATFIGLDQLFAATSFWNYWLALCWLGWAALWFAYFVLGVHGEKRFITTRNVALLTIAESILTAWLPGYLILSRHMPG